MPHLRVSLLCFLLLSGLHIHAHNAQYSSLRISRQDSTWMLSISASLAAFHYELEARHPEMNFQTATSEELLPLLIAHMRQTLRIEANGKLISLENGVVRPGHQTDLFFDLKDMPETLSTLT
ncbi:MAG: hypothetical protein EAZ89_07195, partial [Bacteroidetes bacterium]